MSAIDYTKFKLGPGISWNLVSLVFIGAAGLTLNIIVAAVYGAAILGALHQTLAIYLIISQLAAGGLYFSVLSYLPMNVGNKLQCRAIVLSAVISSGIIASTVAVITYYLADTVGLLISSDVVAAGLRWIAPGLFFFSINKILLFAFNGMGWLAAYAIGQTARFFLILVLLGGHVLFDLSASSLAAIFTVAEALLLIPLIGYWVVNIGVFTPRSYFRSWLAEHRKFCPPAMLNGLLTELNLKIDIVVLGIFTGDAVIGLYAFAANIAEGLAQIPIVLQTVLNPILAPISRIKDQQALNKLCRRFMIWMPAALTGFTIPVIFIYAPLATFLTNDPAFGEAWPVLAVLSAGIIISAGHVPFALILNQVGQPRTYLAFLILVVGSTCVLNIILVPIYGVLGAATAVAGSMVLLVPLLRYFIRRNTGLRLIFKN